MDTYTDSTKDTVTSTPLGLPMDMTADNTEAVSRQTCRDSYSSDWGDNEPMQESEDSCDSFHSRDSCNSPDSCRGEESQGSGNCSNNRFNVDSCNTSASCGGNNNSYGCHANGDCCNSLKSCGNRENYNRCDNGGVSNYYNTNDNTEDSYDHVESTWPETEEARRYLAAWLEDVEKKLDFLYNYEPPEPSEHIIAGTAG